MSEKDYMIRKIMEYHDQNGYDIVMLQRKCKLVTQCVVNCDNRAFL